MSGQKIGAKVTDITFIIFIKTICSICQRDLNINQHHPTGGVLIAG